MSCMYDQSHHTLPITCDSSITLGWAKINSIKGGLQSRKGWRGKTPLPAWCQVVDCLTSSPEGMLLSEL